NNGGATLTHAPLTGSPAIDRGKDFGPVGPGYGATGVDERGHVRPQTYNDPSITPPAGGDRSDIGAVELSPGVMPISEVSRKVHGAAGTFDIPLSLSGPVETECRSGGASGVYQLVLTFATPVTFSSAAVTSGIGVVTSVTLDGQSEGTVGSTVVTIGLSGVTNQQRLTVGLLGVNDGSNSGDVGVRVGMVLGDTTGNGAVASSDVSQTKTQSGQPVSTSNFRNDVNANGAITASDIAIVKAQSGQDLPPVPTEPNRQ
ncbi:MAG: choice-of-anchor Q domain-containing protein, partial [Chthoniobacterales bacterium]